MRDDYEERRGGAIEEGFDEETGKEMITVYSDCRIENVQVKESRGKHVELKVRLPFNGDVLSALGDIMGSYARLKLEYTEAETSEERDERNQSQLDFEDAEVE